MGGSSSREQSSQTQMFGAEQQRADVEARLERVIAAGITILSPSDWDARCSLAGRGRRGVLQCVRQVSRALTAGLHVSPPTCFS
jgi:hypothetical protein